MTIEPAFLDELESHMSAAQRAEREEKYARDCAADAAYRALIRSPAFLAERAAADAEFLAAMKPIIAEIHRVGRDEQAWRASALIASEPAVRRAYEARLRANGERFFDD